MNKKVIKQGIVKIVLYFLITVIVSAVLTLCKVDMKITLYASTIVATLFVIKSSKINLLKELKKFKKEYFKNMIPYYLIGLSLMIFTNFLITLINGGAMAPNEQANRDIILNYKTYSIISTIFLAPIAEEILFRGNFKNLSKNKNTFILATGLLFGFCHILIKPSLFAILYIVPYSILGMALGKIYKECDNNIWANLFTHMFHNILAISLIFIGM